jgi:MoxR-like ATPase
MSPELEEYIVQFIMATRQPEAYGEDMGKLITYGASPRGTIALDITARAAAWLAGRDFVTPTDIQELIPSVLRHRIIPSFEAKSMHLTTDDILDQLLERVPLP